MPGLLPVSLEGPRRFLYWSSRFTRRAVESGLGGEIYARSEMAGLIRMVMGFFAIFGRGQLHPVGSENCDSLSPRLASRQAVTEKYLARRPSAIQDMFKREVLSYVLWIRAPPIPADGVNETQIRFSSSAFDSEDGGFPAEERRSLEKSMVRVLQPAE